jgi:thiol-disulfide isomerase/thioredoxin
MAEKDVCELIGSPKDLEKKIKEKKSVFVLFYASWCPYSQKFLPEFIKSAGVSKECHVRILVDDNDALVDDYSIEVYPTVLYFKDGKLNKRLDGISSVGLNKPQLEDFKKRCGAV